MLLWALHSFLVLNTKGEPLLIFIHPNFVTIGKAMKYLYVACVRLVILLRNPFKWNDLDLTPGLHFRYLILRRPTHSPHKLWTSWKVLFAIAQQLWHRLYLQSHNDAVSSHSTNDFPHPSLILAHSNFQMTKKCNESTFRIFCAFRRMTKCGEEESNHEMRFNSAFQLILFNQP